MIRGAIVRLVAHGAQRRTHDVGLPVRSAHGTTCHQWHAHRWNIEARHVLRHHNARRLLPHGRRRATLVGLHFWMYYYRGARGAARAG